jgi:bacillithiol biosynthesis cysteine-adding enzyme BshC
METHCLRHTEIPGTTRLFRDYIYHFDLLSEYYDHAPYDPQSFSQAAARIDYPASRRAALVAALRATNGDSASLRKLAQPDTVAVVTGQQAGLFSGPAYTIYKALTAVRLAAKLDEQGIPAVPVFWIATEDHDFAEVDHAHVFTSTPRAVTLRALGAGVANQPVGNIPLPAPPVDELAEALAHFPNGDGISALVREAYPPGITAGESFRKLLFALLRKFDLLYLDPLDSEIRRIAAPFLKNALADARGLNAKLRQRGRELESKGYHAQVLVEEDTSLLFRLEGKRRLALRRRNGGYAAREHMYSEGELAATPEQLSPNALLRPVMQDYLLPTVAYVGGGAEIAYIGQSQVIYRELLGRMPVILPRSGFTLIGARTRRQMERYGMPLQSFFAPSEVVRRRIANCLVPPILSERYADTRRKQDGLLDTLREETLRFDPSLARVLDKTRAKLEYQLQKLERKVAAEALRRDGQASRQAEALSTLLYPEKHLQERYYSVLPFMAEYGNGLMNELYENIHLDCPDHKIGIL